MMLNWYWEHQKSHNPGSIPSCTVTALEGFRHAGLLPNATRIQLILIAIPDAPTGPLAGQESVNLEFILPPAGYGFLIEESVIVLDSIRTVERLGSYRC